MTLHLTSCRHADLSEYELRELARRLERGDNDYMKDGGGKPVHIRFGTREAGIVVDALRRVAGR